MNLNDKANNRTLGRQAQHPAGNIMQSSHRPKCPQGVEGGALRGRSQAFFARNNIKFQKVGYFCQAFQMSFAKVIGNV